MQKIVKTRIYDAQELAADINAMPIEEIFGTQAECQEFVKYFGYDDTSKYVIKIS